MPNWILKKVLIIHCMFLLACSGQEQIQFETFTEDGAWCWFQDPRAVYIDSNRKRTYAQWMTREGDLQIGAFDHKTSDIEVHTLKEDWGVDDHNVGAFIVLPDNRLMVFYAQHNKTGIYCRTSVQPEDIMEWNDEVVISESSRITYAHPVYLNEEKKFYVFWRGPTWKPTFATSEDGIIWSEAKVLIRDINRESQDIRPYTKITSDGRSSIHYAFTDGHPRNEPQNSIYYLRYENGNFFRANGSIVGNLSDLPIPHSEADLVFDAIKTNVRAWVWDIALDENGYPVIAYTRLPQESDHRYHYARWNGSKWMDVEVVPGGKWFPQTPEDKKESEPHYSGGISINSSNPSILYLSRPVNGIFEIERWSTPDEGATWTSQLISNDSAMINVRPVVPYGDSGNSDIILWMFGEYVHYTNYKTGIKVYFHPGS